jgi:hypothetical protein
MQLTKEEFVKYMSNLKSFYDYYEHLYVVSQGSISILDCKDTSNLIGSYIEMLEKLMGVEHYPTIGSDIQYFVNELDFGTSDIAHEAIKLENGEIVDVSSVEKLYDYLVRCDEEKTSN